MNGQIGEATDYVRMGSHTVGRMDETGAFTWTHGDHLGSASAATNAAGAILWRESYTPFGEVLEDPAANRDEAGFTGHVRDAATGLTYAQARYYNPVTARFLAPDPVGFSSGGPGYFNRYAYTMNDPVNATDPDGAEVQVTYRFVASRQYHMALHLIPDNPGDFAGDNRLDDNRAVLSAFPSNRINLFDMGTLDAELNNPGDVATRRRAVVETPEGLSDSEFIADLLDGFEAYENGEIPYSLLPNEGGEARNSNGWVSGLLGASGAELPDTQFSTPGADVPVDEEAFEEEGQ